MLKLIVGVKGTGKTKALIEMVNTAAETSKGNVVCLEKGNKLRYDIKYLARLIDTSEYCVCDGQSLFGFIAGIYASNHDITDIFVDSALKICNNDLDSFDIFVSEIAKFAEAHNIKTVLTVSLEPERLTETMKQYI